MISTIQLLYKLDLKLNKVATETHQAIPIEDKILALNEAQLRLVKSKVDSDNKYKAGMDSFKKRYSDLQCLIVDNTSLYPVVSDSLYPAYEGDLTQLPQKMMFPMLVAGLCSRGQCKDRIVVVERIVKHADLGTIYNNPFWEPSFEYQSTIGQYTNNKILFYTDGTFAVDSIQLTYLRYPKKIDFEGYINFDGTSSTTVDCELEDYLEDELLEMAVLELGLDTENETVIKTSELRNKNNE